MSSLDSRVVGAAVATGALIGVVGLTVMNQRQRAADDARFQALREELLGAKHSGHGDPSEGPAYKAEVRVQRSKEAGHTSRWTKPVVVAPPSLMDLARTIEKRLGSPDVPEDSPTLVIDRFKSNDPDIKFNWQRVVGRKVVFLFDTVNQDLFFEQLSLLQAMQGFAVPDAEDKTSKWKTYVGRGKYAWGRASHVTVILPWYRPCQMERTSRWQLEAGTWTNGHPDGEWLDVPTAQYMARLLSTPGSVPPLPGPSSALDGMPLVPLWRPPLELLFVELHEEAPIMHCVSDLGSTIRMERFVPYFLDQFRRRSTYPGNAHTYILFPDRGAFDRYAHSAQAKMSLDWNHILYMKKTRVGDSITQEQKLFYPRAGKEDGEHTSFVADDHVLIIDDFTNSGSTLFGAANLAQSMATSGVKLGCSIFVSHLVAAYDAEVVESVRTKLHALGPEVKFFCTNSIPLTTNLLKGDPQITVVDISDFIADMVQEKKD